MKKILVISLATLLGVFSLAFSQERKGGGGAPIAGPTPIPKFTAPDGAKVGPHLSGVGDLGSFRLTSKRGKRSELLASVQIKKGKRVVFISDDVLRRGAPRDPNAVPTASYITFKDSMTQQLNNISSGSGSPSTLRWPWKCVFYCMAHQSCEDYDWIGFWD